MLLRQISANQIWKTLGESDVFVRMINFGFCLVVANYIAHMRSLMVARAHLLYFECVSKLVRRSGARGKRERKR